MKSCVEKDISLTINIKYNNLICFFKFGTELVLLYIFL